MSGRSAPCATALVIAVMLAAPAARAEPPSPRPTPAASSPVGASPSSPPIEPSPTEPPPITRRRRAAAIAAAIVPGVVVRGAGSYLVHDRSAARRLALTSAIGFGAMLVGGLPLAITRGNKYTVVPFVPIAIVGSGVFFGSWIADVWVAAGGACLCGVPRAPLPWTVEAGTTWLRDAHRDRLYARGQGQVAIGRVELGAIGLRDLGGAATEATIEAAVRIRGDAPTGAVVADGSRLTIRTAVRYRDDDDDRLSVATAEAEVVARIDLHRLAAALAGGFAEFSAGLGVERVAYDADGHDRSTLLLGGFAWGAYLGDRGELKGFYDHRRDDLAGGLSAWRASGFLGSLGAVVDVRVVGPWAVRGGLQIGTGWVTTLGVRYQGGRR